MVCQQKKIVATRLPVCKHESVNLPFAGLVVRYVIRNLNALYDLVPFTYHEVTLSGTVVQIIHIPSLQFAFANPQRLILQKIFIPIALFYKKTHFRLPYSAKCFW